MRATLTATAPVFYDHKMCCLAAAGHLFPKFCSTAFYCTLPRISHCSGKYLRLSCSSIKTSVSIRAESSGPESWGELKKWERGGGIVHKSADVHSTVIVEVGAVVHAAAAIGPSTCIGSGSIVGPNVIIGSSNKISYNVVLQNCTLGDFCTIHSGVCIGQDGFGFTVDGSGQVLKKPQELFVRVGDYVEIGANSCIDRGSWRDTVIGNHTKIDNLVQIGHNVIIGHSCMLCGQVGLGGSCTLGDYVVLGGKAGVKDHTTIVSKVRVAAKSGVTTDILISGDYAGFPAVPVHEWRRSKVAMRKLGRMCPNSVQEQ